MKTKAVMVIASWDCQGIIKYQAVLLITGPYETPFQSRQPTSSITCDCSHEMDVVRVLIFRLPQYYPDLSPSDYSIPHTK